MLYKFKHLKSEYSVCISRSHKGRISTYACNTHVAANMQNGAGLFTFEKRENLLLNGREPEHPVDIMMWRLGNALYPFTFRISNNGGIIGFENIKHIQNRWVLRSKEILREMGYSPAVKRYMSGSWLNIKDMNKLRSAILKDSFINLYLATYGRTINFIAHNFPYQGVCNTFKLSVFDNNEESICLSDTYGNGKLSYTRSKYGDLLALEGIFSLYDEQGVHRLALEIKNNRNKMEIK